MGKEQRPTGISPEGFQAHQRLIALASPKLTRAVKSDLILFARRFHRATAERLSTFLGSLIVEPISVVGQVGFVREIVWAIGARVE